MSSYDPFEPTASAHTSNQPQSSQPTQPLPPLTPPGGHTPTATPASSASPSVTEGNGTAPAPTAAYASAPGSVAAPAPEAPAPGGEAFRRADAAAAPAVLPEPAATARRRRSPGWGALVAATLSAALLASGGTVAGMHYLGYPTSHTAVTQQSSRATEGHMTAAVSSDGTAPDWQAVSAAVANSVVSIATQTSTGGAEGSGVIYDSAGHIVTNNHVVAGAEKIQVTLADGRMYKASITGTDPATDLAVIALENPPADLTVARMGNSDDVVSGEPVMAIGNPLGLSSTVTTGIVSALNRPVVTKPEKQADSGNPFLREQGGARQSPNDNVYTNAIQIDAAINPGNSGGPVFDATGAVIGISSSIATQSEESGSIGLGFAIPVNLAVKTADQLIASGTATHAYLGVSIGDGAARIGDDVRAGAEVGAVENNSPAAEAGVQQGDVIVAIDGKPVSQAAALTAYVRQYSSGDDVTLTVARNGQEENLHVTLAERPDSN